MRFLLDANLPRSAIAAVARFGHQVEFARDIGLASAADAQVAAHALATDAAIISRDLDFADIRQYPPDKYSGLVVLRLPDDMVAMEIASVLERFLSEPRFTDQLRGRLAIVEKDRVRFRPSLERGDSTA